MKLTMFVAVAIGLMLSGCLGPQVTQQELNRQIALTRAQYEQQIEDLRSQINRLAVASGERESLLARVNALKREFQALQGTLETMRTERDAANAENVELRRLRDDAERLTAEARQIQERAAAAERERDEIRQELQKFIDLGAIGVEATTDGVMITMRDAILFESGKADLKASSADLLAKIAQVLSRSRARAFRVAGHTDNVPIRSEAFPSNWELSAARALSVLHNLADRHRVPPGKLVAMGFGENRPVASNATADGRAKNRRVEIYLVPESR